MSLQRALNDYGIWIPKFSRHWCDSSYEACQSCCIVYTEGLSVWKRNQFTTEKLQGTVGPDERFPAPGSTKSADQRQAKDLMP